jgi:hypothetical protein
MKDSKTIKLLCAIVVLLITISSFSQVAEDTPEGFGDNVIDNTTTPAAPVSDYIEVAIVLGSLYAFYLTRRRVKKSH